MLFISVKKPYFPDPLILPASSRQCQDTAPHLEHWTWDPSAQGIISFLVSSFPNGSKSKDFPRGFQVAGCENRKLPAWASATAASRACGLAFSTQQPQGRSWLTEIPAGQVRKKKLNTNDLTALSPCLHKNEGGMATWIVSQGFLVSESMSFCEILQTWSLHRY